MRWLPCADIAPDTLPGEAWITLTEERKHWFEAETDTEILDVTVDSPLGEEVDDPGCSCSQGCG